MVSSSHPDVPHGQLVWAPGSSLSLVSQGGRCLHLPISPLIQFTEAFVVTGVYSLPYGELWTQPWSLISGSFLPLESGCGSGFSRWGWQGRALAPGRGPGLETGRLHGVRGQLLGLLSIGPFFAPFQVPREVSQHMVNQFPSSSLCL